MVTVDDREQARCETSENRMGRWACLHNPVPDPARSSLHIQLHLDRPTRNPLVACSHPLAQSHCLRRNCYPPQTWCSLSVPQTRPRESHSSRYCFEPCITRMFRSILFLTLVTFNPPYILNLAMKLNLSRRPIKLFIRNHTFEIYKIT